MSSSFPTAIGNPREDSLDPRVKPEDDVSFTHRRQVQSDTHSALRIQHFLLLAFLFLTTIISTMSVWTVFIITFCTQSKLLEQSAQETVTAFSVFSHSIFTSFHSLIVTF